MFKNKQWFGAWSSKPKNPHSLDQLKYLYQVMSRNEIVTEQNRTLLVETLRSIAEILIWGDQNDSTVFDFFLEKNMLSFFLKIISQKCGSYVCVQLLQTLNILFENIRNETSIYYLLSNNHVNSIIVHKFDFSDEEVMAYYISFLKTLSLKLNTHTVHFFFNEHTNDFPLYTEAIKFFNHPEKMVRIAVRTLTLNVFRVEEKSMLNFICDKTAAPYFSNLVWFIGNHVLDIDNLLKRHNFDQQMIIRLDDLVAEHLDHLHYLNDILLLRIEDLNQILTDNLLNRLLIPLYIYSLITPSPEDRDSLSTRPRTSRVVSLFLLSQVFLIISFENLVQKLVDIILNSNMSIFREPEFARPSETLEESLAAGKVSQPSQDEDSPSRGSQQKLEEGKVKSPNQSPKKHESPSNSKSGTMLNKQALVEESARAQVEDANELVNEKRDSDNQMEISEDVAQIAEIRTSSAKSSGVVTEGGSDPDQDQETPISSCSMTDEEKAAANMNVKTFPDEEKPVLEAIFNSLDVKNQSDDHGTLFSLCLLYAILNNNGVDQKLLQNIVILPSDSSHAVEPGHPSTSTCCASDNYYSTKLLDLLIEIMRTVSQYNKKVRLVTLEMAILLLKKIALKNSKSLLSDHHLAAIEQAKEEAYVVLRNFFKSEDESLFLDMFEDEFQEMQRRSLNVEYLMMDSNLLLPPSQLTPLMMNGMDFTRRLPCADVERTRYAMRVFFTLRALSLCLRQEQETGLPLAYQDTCVKVDQLLDLNNSDLIACTVITKDHPGHKLRRFLVIDTQQLILIEPDTKRLGWGIAKFVALLQDTEVNPDKDDSRSLNITIRQNSSGTPVSGPIKRALLNLKFVFDDHIRCMAAKQRLTKGRLKARQRKMQQIAKLIELPSYQDYQLSRRSSSSSGPTISVDSGSSSATRSQGHPTQNHHRPLSRGGPRVPGLAVAEFYPMRKPHHHLKSSSGSSSSHRRSSSSHRSASNSSRDSSSPRGRGSHLDGKADEMIPLEDLSPKHNRRNRSKSEMRSSDANQSLSANHEKSEDV